MTNADRIRKMTDEQLAVFLREFDKCIVCQIVCTREYRCDKGIIAWLKREADEPEVRRGRWIKNAMSDGYHCSNCGHHVDSPIGEMIDPRDYECYLDKYCGGCGAKMYQTGGTISKERFAEIVGDDQWLN